jgi:hypothetical protein
LLKVGPLRVQHSKCCYAAFSPDGKLLVTSAVWLKNLTPLRDTTTGKAIGEPIAAVAFHPDGKVLVTADGRGNVTSWELP